MGKNLQLGAEKLPESQFLTVRRGQADSAEAFRFREEELGIEAAAL